MKELPGDVIVDLFEVGDVVVCNNPLYSNMVIGELVALHTAAAGGVWMIALKDEANLLPVMSPPKIRGGDDIPGWRISPLGMDAIPKGEAFAFTTTGFRKANTTEHAFWIKFKARMKKQGKAAEILSIVE